VRSFTLICLFASGIAERLDEPERSGNNKVLRLVGLAGKLSVFVQIAAIPTMSDERERERERADCDSSSLSLPLSDERESSASRLMDIDIAANRRICDLKPGNLHPSEDEPRPAG